MRTITTIAPYTDEHGNQIVGTPAKATGVSVGFLAKNCRLEIAEGVVLEDCSIRFHGDGGRIYIGPTSRYRGTMHLGFQAQVRIGQGLTVTRNCFISCAEGASVRIGDDCMFASLNEIRADDSHGIYDLESGKRLNPSRDILIGNHVWLGAQAVLLGGAQVGAGSLLGLRAVLKGTVPPDSIAVGVPAKVVRRGIRWERPHLWQSKVTFDAPTADAPTADVPTVDAPTVKAALPKDRRRSITRRLAKLRRNPKQFLADSQYPLLRRLSSHLR